jgi:hypothetical protein
MAVLAVNRSAIAPALLMLLPGIIALAFPGLLFRAGAPWRRFIYGRSVEPAAAGLAVTRLMGAVFVIIGLVILGSS